MTLRLGTPFVGVAAGLACLGLAVLIVWEPRAAVAAAFAALLVPKLVRGRFLGTFVLAGLAAAAMVDFPRSILVGDVNASAALTAVFALVGALVVAASPRLRADAAARALELRLLTWFVVFAIASVAWSDPSQAGAQNILVLVAFTTMLAATARATALGEIRPEALNAAFVAAFTLSATLLVAGVVGGALGQPPIVGPRPFALFALICSCWFCARRWPTRRATLPLAAALALITLSLSRMALVAGGLVLVASSLHAPRRRLLRTLSVAGVLAAVVFTLATTDNPLKSRFTGGDVVSVAGIQVNAAGRAEFWRATWESYKRSPVFGQGSGSAEELIAERFSQYSTHPHNDYLRVLHDYGAIGFALWCLALVSGLRATRRRWLDVSTAETKSVHLAAFLAWIALALTMATDNPLVYLPILLPVAVLCGASVGFSNRRRPA